MHVVSHDAGIVSAISETNDILRNIEQNTTKGEYSEPIKSVSSEKGFTLNSKGYMIWWNKLNEAASYKIRLFINNDEIDVVENGRNKCYHTFTDIIGKNMFIVKVEAENRDGEIIDSLSLEI